MTAQIIKLVAPNDLPIVGLRLEDGSTCEFEFSYDSVTKIHYYKLLNRGSADLSKCEGDQVLVDSDGNEWPSADIELDSILKS